MFVGATTASTGRVGGLYSNGVAHASVRHFGL